MNNRVLEVCVTPFCGCGHYLCVCVCVWSDFLCILGCYVCTLYFTLLFYFFYTCDWKFVWQFVYGEWTVAMTITLLHSSVGGVFEYKLVEI